MKTTSFILLLATAFVVLPFAASVTADDPGVCADPCTIGASTTHYDLPVTVVTNGSSVVWHSTDIGHIQAETPTPAGSPASCFSASSPGMGDSPSVTFAIVGSALQATMGTSTLTCANAVASPDGSFVVPYHCKLHADMRGVLVVKA